MEAMSFLFNQDKKLTMSLVNEHYIIEERIKPCEVNIISNCINCFAP